MRMNTEAWWNLCKTVISGILLSVTAVIGFKYLLPPALPFIIALAVASLVRPASKWCKDHLGIGARPVSVVIILGLLGLICFLIWATGTRLIEETGKFLIALSENSHSEDSPLGRLTAMFEGLREKLPLSDKESSVDLYTLAMGFIKSGTEKISSAAAAGVASFIKKLPSAIITWGICFIAMFYLTLDYDRAAKAVKDFLPSGTGDKIVNGYRKVSDALWKYLKAYLTIMLVTFAELYLGFTLLRVEYSLLFAIVTSIVDILPILGVGTVLIPWGIAALLLGNLNLGIGLFILYAVVCLIRQFLEPKIVGDFIGTHPLVALMGVYFGLKLFGFAGMIAAPIVLYLMKALKN